MDFCIIILDKLYYGFIEPLAALVVKGFNLILISPMAAAGVPVPLHIILLATLTALLALWLRTRLMVEERMETFRKTFAAKREQQKNLQLVPDKYIRCALYEAGDDDLNQVYNTFLAHHYSRYVLIYLLPLFLMLALLNSAFSREYLLDHTGMPYLFSLWKNSCGIQGISVTALFLATYITVLIIGFHIRRHPHS